jgi:acetyl-CoA carboxylase biotin carboxylase subunit
LEVSTFYDSLLAKLVVWGESRQAAIQRMAGALGEYRVVGLPTSIPFHRWLMGHEAFRRGAYDTSLLADGFSLAEPDREASRPLAALVAALLSHEQRGRARLALTPCEEADGSAWSARSWKMAGRWEMAGR